LGANGFYACIHPSAFVFNIKQNTLTKQKNEPIARFLKNFDLFQNLLMVEYVFSLFARARFFLKNTYLWLTTCLPAPLRKTSRFFLPTVARFDVAEECRFRRPFAFWTRRGKVKLRAVVEIAVVLVP
jgi:hypothetical protein